MINPTFNRILVRRDEIPPKTKGGIILPDSAKEKPKVGTVVSVGPGRHLESGALVKTPFKEGDRVLFKNYSGDEIEQGEGRFLLLMDHDILATITET